MIQSEIQESFNYCKKLTLGHYENFPVASILIHPFIRKYVFAIYSFARIADDIADELQEKQVALEKLNRLELLLDGQQLSIPEYDHLWPALQYTLTKTNLPVRFLKNLLKAFQYDVHHHHFETWKDMLHYCSYSAKPVGHIILWIHGKYRSPYIEQSDAITTALQLANFWQDISRDKQKKKYYIPLEVLKKFHLSFDDFYNSQKMKQKRELISFLVRQTEKLFWKGHNLWRDLPFRLKYELKLTFWGGMHILKKIEGLRENVFEVRPVLQANDWLVIMKRAWLR